MLGSVNAITEDGQLGGSRYPNLGSPQRRAEKASSEHGANASWSYGQRSCSSVAAS